FLHGLLWYHLILAIAYFVYVQFNRSDSYTYYSTTASYEYGYNWMSYYGVSTTFIKFLAYPLIRMLGLSYEACMAIFAMIGFAGFVFFFRFLREQIKIPVKIFGMDAIYFLLLLPNTHFWTSSLGKGSVIFFGVALLFYALSYIKKRYIALFIAGLTIYHIRPHIFYVFLIALSVGYAFSSKRISLVPRLIIISLAITLLILIYNDILQFTGLEDESMLDPFISHRASELTKAGSGIDITNYNLAQKLFAFLFRPLFFDSPGLMGLIVSFENLIYLILCLEFFRLSAFKYLIQADPITKTAILAFAAVSLALAQISGNLGLAIRQKSQVMLLFLFVIVKLKEERVLEQLKHVYMRRAALSRLKRMEMKQQNS
ncbi:MAG TPA: hypothetical protein PKC24_13655, partial [Cyclobacteriaceae bacterium]|nr:hypothetical protein [Cyclobacteriaceae bacterium]